MKHAFSLASASLKQRWVYTSLSILSVATAFAILCCLFLLARGLNDGFMRNAQGIDAVVGAKGSKLQLILSTVFHSDIPTGNIEESQFESLKKNPQVKAAIPLVIGDSYKGWRIAGTTIDYMKLYKASPIDGRLFDQPFEVLAGSATGLKLGQEFAAVHGFAADGDDVHDFHLYKVVGILGYTGTVIDRLLLTSVESVQQLHAHHDEHEEHEEHEQEGHHDADEEEEAALAHQVTAVLVQVKSPAAIINFPRYINNETSLMAANPGFEMARLWETLGLGKNVVMAISVIILILSGLMLCASLASSLASRQYDLAVLRVLGASGQTLFLTVMIEGVMIGVVGAFAGIFLGHVLAFLVAGGLSSLQAIITPASLLKPHCFDLIFVLIGFLTGTMASLFPAIFARKLDISSLLVRGR